MLGSGGSGDDTLQVKLAILGIVVSLIVTSMLPIMLYSNPAGYDMQTVQEIRDDMTRFTGKTMVNQAPFVLQHVYTPYAIGEEWHTTEEGWLYGEELGYTDPETEEFIPGYTDPITGQQLIDGHTTQIRLDPNHKSDTPLFQSDYSAVVTIPNAKWYFKPAFGLYGEEDEPEDGIYTPTFPASSAPGSLNIFGMLAEWLGFDVWESETVTYPAWNFSGYRYELDPVLRINTENGTSTKAVTDAKLSIVWYDLDGTGGSSTQGISGGLILYNQKTNGIVAHFTAAEIIAGYNTASMKASEYILNFEGIEISMYIQFDADVRTNPLGLDAAWNSGQWTVAFSTYSADMFLDIENSTSFTASVGNLINTYIQIFTFNVPDVSAEWDLVLWVVCGLPLMLAMILFLSRFGLAGIGAGILGGVLMGGVL